MQGNFLSKVTKLLNETLKKNIFKCTKQKTMKISFVLLINPGFKLNFKILYQKKLLAVIYKTEKLKADAFIDCTL